MAYTLYTAVHCVWLDGDDNPTMADISAILDTAFFNLRSARETAPAAEAWASTCRTQAHSSSSGTGLTHPCVRARISRAWAMASGIMPQQKGAIDRMAVHRPAHPCVEATLTMAVCAHLVVEDGR